MTGGVGWSPRTGRCRGCTTPAPPGRCGWLVAATHVPTPSGRSTGRRPGRCSGGTSRSPRPRGTTSRQTRTTRWRASSPSPGSTRFSSSPRSARTPRPWPEKDRAPSECVRPARWFPAPHRRRSVSRELSTARVQRCSIANGTVDTRPNTTGSGRWANVSWLSGRVARGRYRGAPENPKLTDCVRLLHCPKVHAWIGPGERGRPLSRAKSNSKSNPARPQESLPRHPRCPWETAREWRASRRARHYVSSGQSSQKAHSLREAGQRYRWLRSSRCCVLRKRIVQRTPRFSSDASGHRCYRDSGRSTRYVRSRHPFMSRRDGDGRPRVVLAGPGWGLSEGRCPGSGRRHWIERSSPIAHPGPPLLWGSGRRACG